MEYSREFMLLKNMVRSILGRWFGGCNSMDDEIDELTSYVSRFVSKDTSLSNIEIIKEAIEVYNGNKFQNKHHDFELINCKLKALLGGRDDYAKIQFADLTLFVVNFIKTKGYASLYGDVICDLKSNIASDKVVYDDYLKSVTYEYFKKVKEIKKTRPDNDVEPYGVTLDIIYDIVKDRADYDKLNLIEIKEFVDEYISNNKGSYNSSINFREVVQKYFNLKAETERYDKRWNTCWFDIGTPKKVNEQVPLETKEEVLCVCKMNHAMQLGAFQAIITGDLDMNALGLVLVTFEQIPGKNEFQLTTRRRFISVDDFKRDTVAGPNGTKPVYLRFSHAFELMKAGFKCSPLLHQEYEYCFGIKDVGYKTVHGVELPNQNTPGIVIMQYLSKKAIGISSPISPTIDNFTIGMMLDDWKVV